MSTDRANETVVIKIAVFCSVTFRRHQWASISDKFMLVLSAQSFLVSGPTGTKTIFFETLIVMIIF
jgi:hypothetical protein